MIRRLSEPDRETTLQLLDENRSYNLYLLGNLPRLGFETEYCEFWGDFAREGLRLRAVLNRYMSGWSLFGHPDADWPGLAAVIDAHPQQAARLQDNPGGTDSLLPLLKSYTPVRVVREQMMTLQKPDFRATDVPDWCVVRRAVPADLAQLIEYYREADDMARNSEAVRRPLLDTRIWVAISGEGIRSAALTNAEIESRAMIGGVFTKPEYRGRGLGQAVCSALCADLLLEGKQPVLYWQTPAAGAIYRKLGFRAIGYWRSVWLQRT